MYNKKVLQHFTNPKFFGKIKNPDVVGKAGNPRCVIPDTLIYLNSHITEIKDLKRGQDVLGHNGKYYRIKNIHRRPYKGKIYSIRVHNLGRVSLTPEHLILAIKTDKVRQNKSKIHKKLLPSWYHVEDLSKGDTILYPILQETIDIRSIKLGIEKPKWDFKSKALPKEINITPSFLRLAGYFLAEGHVRTDKCKGTVGFSFNSKEVDYINDTIYLMKRIFNITPAKLVDERNTTNILFYSARLARFFAKLFGKGAKNKSLPHWMLLLPIRKQAQILCGLWRGDGYVNSHRAKYVTISKQLAYQVRVLLLRQKIISSFFTIPSTGMHKESYPIFIQDDSSLKKIANIVGTNINIPAKRKEIYKSWLDKKYYYTGIQEIKSVSHKGFVYNLEVDGSHSFVSDAATLHNCGDLLTLYLKIDNKKIKDIKFETLGCAAAIAASDMICQLVKGRTLNQALKVSFQDVSKELGVLPPLKIHCAQLVTEALRDAVKKYK